MKNVALNQRSKIKRNELALLQLIGSGAVGDVYRVLLIIGHIERRRSSSKKITCI